MSLPARLAAIRNTGAAGVVRRSFPTLVSFTDADDPKSVEEVDPLNAGATLGGGYALRELRIQVVPDGEPLTTGIEGVLPWLGSVYEQRLGKSSSPEGPQPLYVYLRHGSFRTKPKTR